LYEDVRHFSVILQLYNEIITKNFERLRRLGNFEGTSDKINPDPSRYQRFSRFKGKLQHYMQKGYRPVKAWVDYVLIWQQEGEAINFAKISGKYLKL